MQQTSSLRLTPIFEQLAADAHEDRRAKRTRDGLVAWRALAILGRKLTVSAEAREVNDVLDTVLQATQNLVFLWWQLASQGDDLAERERLATQWHEIAESRAKLQRVR
jgi:hypothetical protein